MPTTSKSITTIVPIKPGPIQTYILANTPVPILLKRYLHELDPGQYEFIEDFYLPSPIKKTLEKMGLKMMSRNENSIYFLKDRNPLRMGVITRKEYPVPAETIHNLYQSLANFMSITKHSKEEFMMLPYKQRYEEKGVLPVFCPLIIVVWTADQTPLERLLGNKKISKIPPKWLQKAEDSRKVPNPNVIQQWNQISYEFLETAPDGFSRKYYLKQNSENWVASILATNGSQPRDICLEFFQEIGSKENPLLAHKMMRQRSEIRKMKSFTIVVEKNSNFRAINCGMTPIFWSSRTESLIFFPDSSAPENWTEGEDSIHTAEKIKVLQGTLSPGDCLFVLPEKPHVQTLNEFQELFRSSRNAYRQIHERILRENFGKILLLNRT